MSRNALTAASVWFFDRTGLRWWMPISRWTSPYCGRCNSCGDAGCRCGSACDEGWFCLYPGIKAATEQAVAEGWAAIEYRGKP